MGSENDLTQHNNDNQTASEHVSEESITDRDDFCLLTSLLWVRQGRLVSIATIDPNHTTVISESEDSLSLSDQPEPRLFPYHRDRLVSGARALKWQHVEATLASEDGLKRLLDSVQLHLSRLPELSEKEIEMRKMRILLTKHGSISVDSNAFALSTVTTVPTGLFVPATFELTDVKSGVSQVFIDHKPTRASLFTTHKTSYRTQYDAARSRLKITKALPTVAEVLLFNEENEIMECSSCTVYVRHNHRWITPAASTGCNLGVTRRLALEQSLCIEGVLHIAQVQHGDLIWMSNAVRGFIPGRINKLIT